ncbi:MULTISPECIES: hypothetical protein [unclassified Brevundimonas]|uniref:hypothetical protein n=1 Tax=unclassified Brevundimonas TaxID=2622653 RepID=UPI0006F2A707|nr:MULTISPECIES: hypothetical protein [unclassified Brevundimonas]KQY85720.1 hypothetical protein ASD25_23470 [Brevundimonas sp. Root1423]KRA26512.1 hypothetical protein ASD59_08510 [Brevundimonas sp. Root608]
MYKLVPITTALLLALAAPGAALAQDHGNGNGRGHGGHEGGKQDRGDDRGGRDDDDRGRGRDDRPGRNETPRVARSEVRAARAVEAVRDRRGDDDDRDDRREMRREAARQVFQTRDGRPVVYFNRDDDRGLIAGCPPGLAKKDNGCLPPGQARRIAAAAGVDRYESLWRRAGDESRYRYEDGYLYRMNPQGSLLGYLPVLGGALAPGAAWPSQYAYQPAPDYYSSYFGLPQGQDYRYADGALYGVDPQTQMISQVAALLTGQNLSVGQPLPSGYDVYNVPAAYRDQYVDNANAMYRYNDGYVYQADPKTQLVTAVIQLLT